MVSPVRVATERAYTLGRGRVFLAPYDTLAEERIVRYVGNSPGLTINVTAPRSIEHESSMSGFGLIDDKFTGRSNAYRMNMTLDDAGDENLGLFFGAEVEEIPDPLVADPARAFRRVELENIADGQQYLLTLADDESRVGRGGVRVSAGSLEVGAPAVPVGTVLAMDRSPSHPLDLGPWPYVFYGSDRSRAEALRDAVMADTETYPGLFDEYDDSSGTRWPAGTHSRIALILLWGAVGSLTWGVQRRHYIDDNDRVGPDKKEWETLGGNYLPTASEALFEESGAGFHVDRETGILTLTDVRALSSTDEMAFVYTTGAGTKISSGAGGKRFAELRYFENNPRGPNRVWLFPRCVVSPDGEFALKGNSWREMNFVVDILPPPEGQAIQVFGSG